MGNQTFAAVLANISAEWRASIRLRAGVYALLGIFWLYGVLVLKDVVAAERTAWAAMESKISRARATAAVADWSTRAQEVKTAVADLETLLWREGSVGLSQASFEERVSQSLVQAGMPLRSIRTTATDGAGLSGQLGLIELRARVQTDFRPATMYPWLNTIGRQKFDKTSTVFVESLVIRQASFGQPATAEIELVGYAIKPSGGANNASTSNAPAPGARQ